MKKLLLVRHAKAVHDSAYDDYERPLKNSGIRDATIMAERLESEDIIPEMIVTSPSLRTQATADIITEHLSIAISQKVKKIYDASQRELLNIISNFDDKFDFIGLVGHNPGISQLVDYFTDKSPDVPPGAIALISFDVAEWKMLSGSTGSLTWFSSPKED